MTTTSDLPTGKHPGVYLRQMLEDREWSQVDLTFILGKNPKSVNQIINGKQGVSHAMSKALGVAFGIDSDYFAGLQNAYELSCAEPPSESVTLRANMQQKYPIREMIKRRWIEDGNAEHLSKELANFFGVEDTKEIPYLAHSAKKSNYDEDQIPPTQLAWLFRVKQIASSFSVPKYSQSLLKKSLSELRSMLENPEETRNVPKVLMQAGVKFIVVETLPKAKIDGVCFWLNDNEPVIGMSARYDRIDNFWFVLRHEIEHVLQGHGQSGKDMIDAELEGDKAGTGESVAEEERIANAAAAEFCVPSKKIESFIRRKNPFFYEKDVIAFSKINKIHPGLVVGQIQRRLNKYNYLRAHQVKIRQWLLPGSIVDGWGQISQYLTR